jgi:hypothetical protein
VNHSEAERRWEMKRLEPSFGDSVNPTDNEEAKEPGTAELDESVLSR